MADTAKKGLFSRLIEGKDRDESYARSTLPTNRWQLFWDILKNNLSKILIINLLIILFCLPVVALVLIRQILISGQASLSPISQNIGIGYPAYPPVEGLTTQILYNANFFFYSLLIVAGIIASVGISGAFYVLRNMVWTEGTFVMSDFWLGVKKNYLIVMPTILLFTIILWICSLSRAYTDILFAAGEMNYFLSVLVKGTGWVLIVFSAIVACFMLTLGVTYDLSFFKVMRNAVILTLGLLPINIFFIALCIAPFILYLFGSFLMSLVQVYLFTIGIATAILGWTDYSQWVFDKYINDKVPGAQKNRGIYENLNKDSSKALQMRKEELESFGPSTLTARPIKPITDEDVTLHELPETFGRDDLLKLSESKEAMYEDSDKYVEEHINDEQFVRRREEEKQEAERLEAERLEAEKAAKKNKKKGSDKPDFLSPTDDKNKKK